MTNGFLGLAASMSGKRRKPKLVEPKDFINKDFAKLMERLIKYGTLGGNEAQPARKTDWASLIEDAKAKGLNVPAK